MHYSSQLQYNLISIIKLDKKRIETLLSLLIKLSKLLMKNDVIAVVDIINSQYVLRKNSELRILAKLADLEIRIWYVRMRHLRYDNLIKLQNQIDELNLMSESKNRMKFVKHVRLIDRSETSIEHLAHQSLNFFKLFILIWRNRCHVLDQIIVYYMNFRDE
jgi:alpha-glucuronidase